MTVKKIQYIQNATVMYVMCDDTNSVLRNQTGNEAFGVCKHALNQEGNLKMKRQEFGYLSLTTLTLNSGYLLSPNISLKRS